jgi:hypothetical protein
MTSAWREKGAPLTASQKGELIRLFEVRALSRETAAHAYSPGMQGCNPSVIGALANKGFAEARGKRSGGRTLTHYWLTAEGLDQVERLTGTPLRERAR